MLVRRQRALFVACCPMLALVLTLLLAGSAAAVGYPFFDDMENTGSGNWTLQSPWG